MRIDAIITKPHFKRRILATLIDYGIYLVFFWVYTTSIGQETETGKWTVDGTAALPLPAFWFIYFVIAEGLKPGNTWSRYM